MCSVIASLCFGVASFFLGDVSDKGIVGKFLMSFGFIIISVLYMLFCFISNAYNGRRVWSFVDNDVVKPNRDGTSTILYGAFLGMVCSGVFNFIGSWLVTVTFETSIYAGVNQGVMSSLFVLSALFCAIFAYILLNEKMDLSQYMGMVLMIVCAVLLSLSQDSDNIPVEQPMVQPVAPANSSVMAELTQEQVQNTEKQTMSAIIPVIAAIGSSLGFGVRSIATKYYVDKGYNVYNFAMQALFVDGLIGSIGLIIQYETSDIITSDIFLKGLLSGLISGIGIVLINYSIAVGIAGPASAMANLAAVFQTILAYSILGQVLNAMQIIGLIVGLVGALVLALGMDIINKLRGNTRPKDD